MGMLFRILLLAGFVWLVMRLLKNASRAIHDNGENPPAPMMRQCRCCGLNIPETESTQSQGHFFCCEAHRDAFLQRTP